MFILDYKRTKYSRIVQVDKIMNCSRKTFALIYSPVRYLHNQDFSQQEYKILDEFFQDVLYMIVNDPVLPVEELSHTDKVK